MLTEPGHFDYNYVFYTIPFIFTYMIMWKFKKEIYKLLIFLRITCLLLAAKESS